MVQYQQLSQAVILIEHSKRLSGYERMEHGTSRSFVVTHPDDIGQVKRVEFYWEYDMDVLQPRSICFFWCNDHLYVSSVGVAEADGDSSRGYVIATVQRRRRNARLDFQPISCTSIDRSTSLKPDFVIDLNSN